MDIRLGGNFYHLGRQIGAGAYGDVHVATNLRTREEVAVKLEPAKQKSQQLLKEAMLYQLLQGAPGIPQVRWRGVMGDLNVMVMDLLGPSLEDLIALRRARARRSSGGLGLRRVVAIGEQALDRLEHLHRRNIVHRDVKPENFCVGRGASAGLVHIIDFGLAKKYRDARTQEHIAAKENLRPTGSIAFSSVGATRGAEQSRRDDLESLSYMLIYMLRGKLPWLIDLPASSPPPPTTATAAAAAGALPSPPPSPDDGGSSSQRRLERQRRENLAIEKKLNTTMEALCRKCPPELATFAKYCRGLGFEEEPDYAYLRNLLRSAVPTAGGTPALGPLTASPVEGEVADALEWWLADEPEYGAKTLRFASKLAALAKKERAAGAGAAPAWRRCSDGARATSHQENQSGPHRSSTRGGAPPAQGVAAGEDKALPSLLVSLNRRGAVHDDDAHGPGADGSGTEDQVTSVDSYESEATPPELADENPNVEESNPVMVPPSGGGDEIWSRNEDTVEENPVFQADPDVIDLREGPVVGWLGLLGAARTKLRMM